MNEIYLTPSCLNRSFLVVKTKEELTNYLRKDGEEEVSEKFKKNIHCNHCKSVTSKWYKLPNLTCGYCLNCIGKDAEFYTNGMESYCKLSCLEKMKLQVSCFKKKIHNKLREEDLLPCSFCSRPFHTSCGMINTYSKDDDFMCCYCILEYMNTLGFDRLVDRQSQRAFDLPTTPLSCKMEEYIKDASIVVRVVSKSSTNNEKEDYVIFVFQKLDNGFDVLIFIIYSEFWLDSTVSIPGNKNTMYISYLDSVAAYSPAENRKLLYQTCLLCLMEYATSTKGTSKCFLWACPPPSGVEFIYNHRPESVIVGKRKNKKTLLISWYKSMFNLGVKRGIISSHMTLSEYFKKEAITRVDQCSFFYGDFISLVKESFDSLSNEPRKFIGKGVDRREMTLVDEINVEINAKLNKSGLLMCYLTPSPKVTPIPFVAIDSPLVRHRVTFHAMLVDNTLQFNDMQHITHSTSMILFYLNNPSKSFFIQRCNACFKRIHAEFDVEYSCDECVNPSFVICEHCYLSKSHGHEHVITNTDDSHLVKMKTLEHVMACRGPCLDSNCVELKANLNHVCDSFGICKTCKKLGLVDHALVCLSLDCVYPNCKKIKNLFQGGQERLYNNNRLNNYKKQEEEDDE